jgi:hypothetical protein
MKDEILQLIQRQGQAEIASTNFTLHTFLALSLYLLALSLMLLA